MAESTREAIRSGALSRDYRLGSVKMVCGRGREGAWDVELCLEELCLEEPWDRTDWAHMGCEPRTPAPTAKVGRAVASTRWPQSMGPAPAAEKATRPKLLLCPKPSVY